MQTIIFNGKSLRISASEQRFLEILRNQDYAARKGDFAEGSGNYRRSILPFGAEALAKLGVAERSGARWSDGPAPLSAREARFFKEHPRCQTGIFGNPRKVNAILNKLDERASLGSIV